MLGPRADVDADLAGLGVQAREHEHRIGEAAALAHLLKQPRGGRGAEHPLEHAQRKAPLVIAREAAAAETHVVLLGVFAHEAHARREGEHAIGAHRVMRVLSGRGRAA